MIDLMFAGILQGALPDVRPLQIGDTVPDSAFVDQLGRKRSWSDYRGHITVISFMYSRCPDVRLCSLVSAKFAELQDSLPGDARLIEFTLDSAYDTPTILERYGQLFGARPGRWTLATGDGEAMREIALSFGVGIASRVRATVVHSETLGIVDRSGRVLDLVDGNSWDPQDVVASVRNAEGFGSNPWERFMLGFRRVARECGAAGAALGHEMEMLVVVTAITVIVAAVFIIEVISRGLGTSRKK